jgi:hypothetical protein
MESALDVQIAELQQALAAENERHRQLEEQFKYRVGAFVKRESLARKTVEALERKLQGPSNAEEEHKQRMSLIRNMHDSVVGGLACIQANTAKILQDQEKDLMRAFRARLQDVSYALESNRSKKGDFSAELQARHRRVVAELHASQELTHIFDRKNQGLQQENAQLQEWLKRRIDDRAQLLRELVMTRREGGRLKVVVGRKAKDDHRESSIDDLVENAQPKTATRNISFERELKLREEVKKARRQMRTAQREAGSWQEAQKRHLTQRAELEVFVRQCMDDVQKEMSLARQRNEQTDLIEVLEAQERVIHLVYGKCFPNRPPSPDELADPEDPLLDSDVHDLIGPEGVTELPPLAMTSPSPSPPDRAPSRDGAAGM